MEDLLVPGRECGECRVCCEVLHIDTEEIQKASRVLCHHYKGGCTIYENRPQVCRGYFCGWRMLENLDDDWRPDKSGILVGFQNNGIPEGYAPGSGIEFCLLKPEAVSEPGLAKVVTQHVAAGTPVFLKLLGPRGYKSANVFLNNLLRDVAVAGEQHLVQKGLQTVLSLLVNRKTQPAGFAAVPNPGVRRQE